jgi:hypothetical protein
MLWGLLIKEKEVKSFIFFQSFATSVAIDSAISS